MIKATIKENYSGEITPSHRKDMLMTGYKLVTAMPDYKIKELVDARIYGTQARNYACVWIKRDGAWTAGSGYAGGYGYHRPSAALEVALEKAGVTLSSQIGGVGDDAMKEALYAVAEAMGYDRNKVSIITSHA